jgi:hypothetical protein
VALLTGLPDNPAQSGSRAHGGQPAQSGYPAAEPGALATPEGAAYARVRQLDGAVTLFRDSEVVETMAEINTPLAAGDIIETGSPGRMEVQLADGSLLWLDDASRVTFLTLADSGGRYENRTLMGLDSGSLVLLVEDFDPDEKIVRVDTVAATIFFLEPGLYRIDLGAGGGTQVISRAGVAEVLARDRSVLVRSGEGTFVAPGFEPESPRIVNTRNTDAFDGYVEDRRLVYLDASRGSAPSYLRYEEEIPEEVLPYAGELDYYGEWNRDPAYGVVWVPAVSSHWRPYHRGRWMYRPIGWTWVSYDPWGYAPYHYGRWEFLPAYGWCWMPGRVYAPAWVGWGYSGGYVGWCPLGWYNYPTGWSISISFGSFHASHWSFVGYNQFHQRNVHNVVINNGIIADQVVYASRAPRVAADELHAGRGAARFEESYRDARRAADRGRDAGVRRGDEQSFRTKETAILASARDASRGTEQPRRRPLATSFRETAPAGETARSSSGTRQVPAVQRESGSASRAERARPSRRDSTGAVRGETSSPARKEITPSSGTARERVTGGESGRAAPSRRQTTGTAGRETSRPTRKEITPSSGTAGSRAAGGESGRAAPRRREVPASEPRRILTDTRTRRTPAAGSSTERRSTSGRTQPQQAERRQTTGRTQPQQAERRQTTSRSQPQQAKRPSSTRPQPPSKAERQPERRPEKKPADRTQSRGKQEPKKKDDKPPESRRTRSGSGRPGGRPRR